PDATHSSPQSFATESFGECVEEVQRLPVGINRQALILTVGAIVIALEGNCGVAVRGDADLSEVDGVAGAVLHDRSDGNAGPDLLGDAGERVEDFLDRRRRDDRFAVWGRFGYDAGVGDVLHAELGVGEELDEVLTDFFR